MFQNCISICHLKLYQLIKRCCKRKTIFGQEVDWSQQFQDYGPDSLMPFLSLFSCCRGQKLNDTLLFPLFSHSGINNRISVPLGLTLLLELFSCVVPIFHSPGGPGTPSCRWWISPLLAELTKHSLTWILTVHPRIGLLPLFLITESGFVDFPLLSFWNTWRISRISGRQVTTTARLSCILLISRCFSRLRRTWSLSRKLPDILIRSATTGTEYCIVCVFVLKWFNGPMSELFPPLG